MADFLIKTNHIKRQKSDLNRTAEELISLADEINSVKVRLAFNGAYRGGISRSLGTIAGKTSESGRTVRDMGSKLEQVVNRYEASERSIANRMSGSPSWKNYIGSAVKASTAIGGLVIDKLIKRPGTSNAEGLKTSVAGVLGYTGVTGSATAAWLKDGKLNPHVGVKGEAKASVAHWEAEAKLGNRQVTAGLDALYAGASGSAEFGWSEDKGLYGEIKGNAEIAGLKGSVSYKDDYLSAGVSAAFLSAGAGAGLKIGGLDKDGNYNFISGNAEAKASVLSGEANAQFGTEDFNLHAKATGSLVGAEANAKFSVGSNGIKAGAGAEAYLAKGEVKGGFTLFGIKIDTKLEGKAGAVGAKGSFEATNTSLNIGAGVSAILGVGVDINIDWSGFKLPSFGGLFGR